MKIDEKRRTARGLPRKENDRERERNGKRQIDRGRETSSKKNVKERER